MVKHCGSDGADETPAVTCLIMGIIFAVKLNSVATKMRLSLKDSSSTSGRSFVRGLGHFVGVALSGDPKDIERTDQCQRTH